MPDEDLTALKVEVGKFTGRVETRLDGIAEKLTEISDGMKHFIPRAEHDRDQMELNRRLVNIEGDLRWLWRTMLTGGISTIGAIVALAKGWIH